jgi:hypothetical protein
MTDLAMPSANSWFGIRLLPVVLSLTAGSMDPRAFGCEGKFGADRPIDAAITPRRRVESGEV